MIEFEHNWGVVNSKRFLFVRPKSAVGDEEWVGFFETQLKDFHDENFLLLIDVVGIEENIGVDGFSRIAKLLIKLNVSRTRIAVLPSNEYYPHLVDLFDTIAKMKDLDLKVELFHKRETAEDWLGNQ